MQHNPAPTTEEYDFPRSYGNFPASAQSQRTSRAAAPLDGALQPLARAKAATAQSARHPRGETAVPITAEAGLFYQQSEKTEHDYNTRSELNKRTKKIDDSDDF